MSAEYKFENHLQNEEETRTQSKVRLTDLLSRINEEKKIERNRYDGQKVFETRTLTFEPYPYDEIEDVIVKIQENKPMSKTKKWIIVS